MIGLRVSDRNATMTLGSGRLSVISIGYSEDLNRRRADSPHIFAGDETIPAVRTPS